MSEETVSTEPTVLDLHVRGMHNRYGAINGDWLDCTICDRFRDEERQAQVRRAEAIRESERINQRIINEELVRCAHSVNNCSQRDGDMLVARALATECTDCYEWFCDIHSHNNPSGVPTQRCHTCDDFAPRCISVWSCDDCNDRICDRCNDSHYCESDFDADDEYRSGTLTFAEGEPHPLALGGRFVGFEVECENGRSPNLPDRFGIHSDGSLSCGVEVVTPPAKGAALVHDIELVMGHLLERGWDVDSGSAGLHTHIDMRDKRDDMVFLSRLFAAFYAVEDVLFALTDGRETSSWCQPLRNDYSFYEMFGQNAPDFDFRYYKADKTPLGKARVDSLKQSHEGTDRYRSFNFQSVFYRGSLEVRMKEGCLDAVDALRWADTLQFIVAGVEKGITYKTLETLLEMDADADKARKMCEIFKFPESVASWVVTKIQDRTGGMWGSALTIEWTKGERKVGRPKAIKKPVQPTHIKCEGCRYFIPLTSVYTGGFHRYDCVRPDVVMTPDRMIYTEPINGQAEAVATAAVVARRRNGAFVRELLADGERIRSTTAAPPVPEVVEASIPLIPAEGCICESCRPDLVSYPSTINEIAF